MTGAGGPRRAATASSRAPSNQTGRYDYERVAKLRPLEAAVKRLGLPPIRSRKLGTILNALEMQIEDGGDSPEVNRLLLEALRAGLRHQADERTIQPALRAIDAYERAEAERVSGMSERTERSEGHERMPKVSSA